MSTHWSEIKAQPHLHNLEEMCDKDLLKGGNPRKSLLSDFYYHEDFRNMNKSFLSKQVSPMKVKVEM